MTKRTIDYKFRGYSYLEIEALRKRAEFIENLFGYGCFTNRDFKAAVECNNFYGFPITIDTYRKNNIIVVNHIETFRVYGMKNDWGYFEVIEGMTDEIYNILPDKLKCLVTVQERQKNYYRFNVEEWNRLNDACKILGSLFD